MNCLKCGAKIGEGDALCPSCGAPVECEKNTEPSREKKKGGFNVWIFLLLCVAVLIPYLTGQKQQKPAATVEIPPENVSIYSGRNTCTPALDTTGLREEKGETWDGELFRYYRQDGTLAAEKVVYGEDAARVSHYDPCGNPLAVFEYDGIQGTYLEYYYENIYDSQLRLCRRTQTNKRGSVSLEESYTYAPDGTYTREITEYRGAWVYVWDQEAHGEDNPVMIYHALVTYDSAGQEISREETILD